MYLEGLITYVTVESNISPQVVSSQIKRGKRVVGKSFITNQSFKVIRHKLENFFCCGTCMWKEMYEDKSTGKLSVT